MKEDAGESIADPANRIVIIIFDINSIFEKK
jgi:hypothetical protein